MSEHEKTMKWLGIMDVVLIVWAVLMVIGPIAACVVGVSNG